MFPLYRIVFHSVPEQTAFNENNILFQAGSEQFLFWFRTERHEY